MLFCNRLLWCLPVIASGLGISALAQPQIDADVSGDFILSTLWDADTAILDVLGDGSVSNGRGIDGQVTQMNFGSDGGLYVAVVDGGKAGASNTEGIWRFDYSTSGLANPTRISTLPTTSLAFHTSGGTEYLYATDAADIFGAGFGVQRGILRRMTDSNGDGIWGGVGDINQVLVDNVPVAREHRMNQITFSGNTLITGIGSMTTDGHAEGAYNTTIGFIEDVTQLGTAANAARLGGPNTFLNAGNELTDNTTPFTSTAADKFRVHSVGVRNAFGVVTDPDGVSYATMNNDQNIPGIGTPSELFFRLQRYGNYGFRQDYDPDAGPVGFLDDRDGNDNETPFVEFSGVGDGPGEAGFSETKNVASITAEGVVPSYNPDLPNGSLGPSAAVGGVDFNTNNGLMLGYHKDAFIGRWNQGDIVAVDIDTGEVERIAHGFNRALEVVRDPFGNILLSEAPSGDTDRARIFLIQGVRARPGQSHLIEFLNQIDSDWSNRSAWGGDFNDDGFFDAPFRINPDDKIVPHQWGDQRYDVTINRQIANLTITLDQDAHIINLLLGNELRLTAGNTLTVDENLILTRFGVLKGNGMIAGNVVSAGTVAVGDSTGQITIDGGLHQTGELVFEIAGLSDLDQLIVTGEVDLSGTLDIVLLSGYEPGTGDTFDLVTASSIVDSGLLLRGEAATNFDLSIIDDGGISKLRLTSVPEPSSLALLAAGSVFFRRRKS